MDDTKRPGTDTGNNGSNLPSASTLRGPSDQTRSEESNQDLAREAEVSDGSGDGRDQGEGDRRKVT